MNFFSSLVSFFSSSADNNSNKGSFWLYNNKDVAETIFGTLDHRLVVVGCCLCRNFFKEAEILVDLVAPSLFEF